MIISNKKDFINQIQSLNTDTEFVVVKPNWVDNEEGNYTEPEILDWLFESLPNQKKVVIESYTPWRGKQYVGSDELGVGLKDGKKFWEFYKEMDKEFLEKIDINRVLKKHDAEYINITNEVWSEKVVEASIIQELVKRKFQKDIDWKEFYSFIPQSLYDIRDKATLISLAKIKLEEENGIMVSFSTKNIFGLIPHPSRMKYHGNNHSLVASAIEDIVKVWVSVFEKNFWINEGITSLVEHYCEPNQSYEYNKGLLFVGTNPIETDRETCIAMKVNPDSVPHLKPLS